MRHTDGLNALKLKTDKFWANVDRSDLFGCWIWNGAIDPGNGYGRPYVNGVRKYAHRASFEMHNGPVPPGLNVLHRCNCKRCVNPLHTYAGDQLQNAADAKAAGALKSHKLNSETAREVFRLRHEGGWSYLGLAEKFGISPQAVANVCTRRTWAKATSDLQAAVKPKKPSSGKKPSTGNPRKPGKPKKIKAIGEAMSVN